MTWSNSLFGGRRTKSPTPGLRLASPVAIGMLAVVASFSATLAFSHWRTEPIEAQALAIIEDAAPGPWADHSPAVRTTRAEAILSARSEAIRTGTALGVGSLVVAVISSFLVFSVLRDRARLMEERARLLADRASELEAFAGRVAHNLKNPLHSLGLRLSLAGARLPAVASLREHLDKAGGQVERMNRIIEGLLEFARAGANPPPGARADLHEILEDVVADERSAANAVDAVIEVEPFSPRALACSPGALTSVFSNLLGNAIKYLADVEHADRRIDVRIQHHDKHTRIEIEDTGPGLPAGFEARVFEPFLRGTETKQPGIGLGLATVKKIVEAYGGQVGVVSTRGKGSTFWFDIPSGPAVTAHAPRTEAGLTPRREYRMETS